MKKVAVKCYDLITGLKLVILIRLFPRGFLDYTDITEMTELSSTSYGPLLKAYNIYSNLRKINELNSFYRQMRDNGLPVIFAEAEESSVNHGLASVMPNLLAKLLGYFSIEISIRRAIDSIIDEDRDNNNDNNNINHDDFKTQITVFSWSELASLWDKACGYLNALIVRNVDNLRTPEQILQIKEEILILNLISLVQMIYFSFHP